jgi:hypothetical protein
MTSIIFLMNLRSARGERRRAPLVRCSGADVVKISIKVHRRADTIWRVVVEDLAVVGRATIPNHPYANWRPSGPRTAIRQCPLMRISEFEGRRRGFQPLPPGTVRKSKEVGFASWSKL